MVVNRRKHAREVVEKNCVVICYSGKWACNGKIKNLSEAGAGIDVAKVPVTRDEIMLHMFDKNGRRIIKKGFVAWFKKRSVPAVGSMMGLQFI